jgi:hypothetical protein
LRVREGIRLTSGIDISGLASARNTCTSKSRGTISRSNRSRLSLEGQVARDPEDSGLDTSTIARAKGVRGNREITSREGSHGGRVENDTWYRTSVFGELGGE